MIGRMESLPLLARRRPLAYAIALGISAVAFWLRYALDAVFPPGFPYLTFFPAVIVSSFLFGRGPGTAAAVVCGLLAWFFFIAPFGSFRLAGGTAVALAFYVGVVGVDIALVHWMQRANGRLRSERERSRALAERSDLLFRELQHRLGNNLQMVGAVLSLQQRDVVDPAARQALTNASTKLHLIGRIQRQLYGTEGELLALDRFLADLVDDLVAAGGKPGVRCALAIEPGILLPPDAAIPVALILAEAIANAVEHGFADRDEGLVDVRVARTADAIELTVRDDGRGLPPGFDPAEAGSLGVRIARTLARQIGATMTLRPHSSGPGTVMALAMPLPAAG
jgi:two-component system, sensor histidine kinase PdtaS